MGVHSVPRTYARTYLHMRHISQHSRNAAFCTGKNLCMSMSAYSMITPTLTTDSVKPHITIMWPASSLRKIKELLLTYSAFRSSYVRTYVRTSPLGGMTCQIARGMECTPTSLTNTVKAFANLSVTQPRQGMRRSAGIWIIDTSGSSRNIVIAEEITANIVFHHREIQHVILFHLLAVHRNKDVDIEQRFF